MNVSRKDWEGSVERFMYVSHGEFICLLKMRRGCTNSSRGEGYRKVWRAQPGVAGKKARAGMKAPSGSRVQMDNR